jgi:hypothetical protein
MAKFESVNQDALAPSMLEIDILLGICYTIIAVAVVIGAYRIYRNISRA